MKRRSIVALLGAGMLGLTACSAGGAGSSPDEVVLGVITDTAGGSSAYAPYADAGMDIAVTEINANGGVAGKDVRIVRKSDDSDTTQTPTIARKLLDEGADVLLFNSGSASAVAGKQVCNEEDVLCVAPQNLSAKIAQPPNNENMFILGPPSSAIGDVLADGMSAAGYERLAVVADESPTIQGYIPAMVNPLEGAGLELVATEKVPTDAADASTQVLRVKNQNPDVVLVLSLGGQTEAVIQNALHQFIPEAARFSLASIGNQPDTWNLAEPGSLEGLVFTGSIDTQNARTQSFEEALQSSGGEYSTLTAYGPQGYDAVKLVAMAATEAGGASDRQSLIDAFTGITDYKPHYGQEEFTISFGPEKHVGADGNCGVVLGQFNERNEPGEPWSVFQPEC